MASASHPPEQQLLDIFDDGEALDSFTRPASDHELLERFPWVYLPGGSFSGGVAGSTTGGVSLDLSPTSVAGPSGSERSQSKRSPRMRPFETSHKGARPPEALAKPTVERLFDPEAEVGKPKRLLTQRNLPTTADLAPVPSADPTRTFSPSSTVTDLSIKPPPSPVSWISASSHIETSTSVLNSRFGTSSSGSFARFPSSAGLTSSYYSGSTARSTTRDRASYEDDSHNEPSGPRQTLSAVNDVPNYFGPERFGDLSGPSPQPGHNSDSEVASSSSAAEGSIAAEWVYPLSLTLEKLFKGGTYTYWMRTRSLSGRVMIKGFPIDVKPGWKTGTRVIFPDAGNERAPGVFQTVIFVVEQVPHEWFTRQEGGKLVCNVYMDPVNALNEYGWRGAYLVLGIDGKVIEFYPPKGVINPGQEMVIKGEGMYTRSKGKVVGRGDLIIRWYIKFPDDVTPDQIRRMRYLL